MNRYKELRDRQQKEFDEANLMGYAFGNEQFKALMERWGINPDKEEELKKVAHVYAGAYILVENIPAYKELRSRQTAEFEAAVAEDKTGDGFIYEMFLYELNNHEYGYTGDTEDTLEELGYSADDIMNNPQLKHGLEKAAGEIMKFEEGKVVWN